MSNSISYTPVFQPPNWTDNVDRVSAGGPTGFNIQFIGLMNEFTQLSTIISQISTALDALSRPVSQTVTLSFAPNFLQDGNKTNWAQSAGLATNAGPSASGWLQLQLPNGSHIQSITVFGQKTGQVTSLQVELVRQTIVDSVSTVMSTIELKDTTGPFQGKGTIPDDQKLIDNTTNKYLVLAKLVPLATPDPSVFVIISAIQVVCTT